MSPHIHTFVLPCSHFVLILPPPSFYYAHIHSFSSPRPQVSPIMSTTSSCHSQSLPHHVYKFVRSSPQLCPAIANRWLTTSTHMCHIMSTPLAHHIHTFFIVVLMSSIQVQSSWFQFRIRAFRLRVKWGIWNAFSMFWSMKELLSF